MVKTFGRPGLGQLTMAIGFYSLAECSSQLFGIESCLWVPKPKPAVSRRQRHGGLSLPVQLFYSESGVSDDDVQQCALDWRDHFATWYAFLS